MLNSGVCLFREREFFTEMRLPFYFQMFSSSSGHAAFFYNFWLSSDLMISGKDAVAIALVFDVFFANNRGR
jgi:hypothetical protein